MGLLLILISLYGIGRFAHILCENLDPTEYYKAFKEDNTLVPQERLDQAMKNMEDGAEKILEREKLDVAQRYVLETGHKLCMEYSYQGCPQNWESSTDAQGKSICLAPPEYTGFCKRHFDFEGVSQEKKAELAILCGFKWPCLDSQSCEPDFSSPCPENFLILNTKSVECVPDPMAYNGVCMKSMNFAGLDDSEKRKWADSCGTRWPCKTTNAKTSARKRRPCPQGWKENLINKSCLSPDGSFCSGEWKFTYWTEKMKEDFSSSCKVPWVFQNFVCQYNLDALCPQGWTYRKEDLRCYASRSPVFPHRVLNTCGISSANFTNLSRNQRYNFMLECHVEWPCVQEMKECSRDWTRECPENWALKDSSSEKCYPLKSFVKSLNQDISCYMAKAFTFWGEEERRKWASMCNAPWPCKNCHEKPANYNELLPDLTEKSLRSISTHRKSIVRHRQNAQGPINPQSGKIITETF